jgi:TolB protein
MYLPIIGELSVMDASPYAPATLLKSHAPKGVISPTWSPDGEEIAYYVSSIPEICILPAAGGEARRVAVGARMAGLDWSPDGTRFVYSSNRSGTDDIWTIPVSGGEESRVTSEPGNERNPRWSPDGTQIAYWAEEAIWVVYASGGAPVRVIHGYDAVPRYDLCWSPDGKSIAFTAGPADGWANIWTQRVR